MSAAPLLDALALPRGTLLERRVPKKLLLESGGLVAADRRLVQEGLDELVWVAVLKPVTIGVPAFRDEVREYLEIAVLAASFRPGARVARLRELIHRAIPYPVVLAGASEVGPELSLAHVRWSEAAQGRTVADAVESSGVVGVEEPSDVTAAFLSALALRVQPSVHLFALYQGWLNCLAALAVARVTGTFAVPGSLEDAAARRGALLAYQDAVREVAGLRARAERETQVGRRAELNVEIQRLRGRIAELKQQL
jgi:hypothetical protein